jgi:uncharacterized membrane protein
VPLRPFAWIALFCGCSRSPQKSVALPDYGIVLLAVALGSWRLERWAGHWAYGRPWDSGAWR